MSNLGGKFLHEKNQSLHTSGPVEFEASRRKKRGEKTSRKPEDKISDWMKVLEQTHTSHRDDPRVLERIKHFYHKQHVIKEEDIPESYFDNQARLARELGHGNIEITDELRQQATEVIIADQKSTLDNWITYLVSPDTDIYPMWAKYWAFINMLKLSSFDKEEHIFSKRSKNTTAPFPDLNREALAYVLDIAIKSVNKENLPIDENNQELRELLKQLNFGKLYAWAIEKVTPTQEVELAKTDGKWIKYLKGSNHMPLVESLQGHATGWCTAGEETAKKQLENGDFYVYYSYDNKGNPTIPRIAIRMQGNDIGEIRGVAKEQNIDPYIANSDIIEDKLKEFGEEGKRYQKKSSDMKYLTSIENKTKQGEDLDVNDLRFLYEFDNKIQGFGYQRDPRIEEIIDKRNIKEDISKITGYHKDEISVTSQEALSGGIKYHYGELYLWSLTSAKGLTLPESIGGNLNLGSLTSAEGLTLPESIGGNLNLESLTSAEGLTLPESIGGNLNLWSLTSAKGLTLPESIGGNLNLGSLTSAEGLTLPESIGGNLNLWSLTSAKGLTLPESIGGNLNLGSLTSAEGLTLPESIGGNLYLWSLTSAEGLTLPESIGGNLNLGSLTSAEGLTLPESIGGNLNLESLTSAEGLTLPESIGGNLNLESLTSAEGLTLPESIGGNLYLWSLTSAKGLTLPESIGGDLNLGSLTSAEGLTLPESIGGDLNLGSLTSAEKDELRNKYPYLRIC